MINPLIEIVKRKPYTSLSLLFVDSSFLSSLPLFVPLGYFYELSAFAFYNANKLIYNT